MPENRPDPDRKPHKSEARMGGMIATAVLVFFGTFHVGFCTGVRQGSHFHRSRGNDNL